MPRLCRCLASVIAAAPVEGVSVLVLRFGNHARLTTNVGHRDEQVARDVDVVSIHVVHPVGGDSCGR